VQHTEQHKLNYASKNDQKHTITCDVAGCDYKATEGDHEYDGDEDTTCNKCEYVREIGGGVEDNYDMVTTAVDFDAAAKEIDKDAKGDFAIPADYTYKGKVTFTATGKSRFEVGSNCFNTQGASGTIIIKLSGVTNSLTIAGKGGSKNFTGYSLTNAAGETVKAEDCGNTDFSFSLTDLPAGYYTLTTNGGAARIKKIEMTEKLEKAEATGISVKALNVDFLKGQDFSTNGLEVTLNYANGRKDTLTANDYEIPADSLSGIDKNNAGKYTVTVQYKENTAFKATYDVYYYTVDSIEIHTIGYNGKNQLTVQQAAIKGGELSYDNLTVKGTGTVGEGETARTHTFNLPAAALNIEQVSVAEAGEQTVNVSVNTEYTTGGTALSDSYKVMVKEAITAADNKVEITVGETGDFKTLTQAAQFIKLCKIGENVNKVIKLQAGTYTEKVWLDIPNVTLMGLGEQADDTVLTYSLVEGDIAAIGDAAWGLGCATLHVTGKNFKAYNLAIRNDFDYINNSGNYSGTQAAQGVALTLEADGAVIYDCHLYGNQDTLYMKEGRSYYYKTQIDGNVDFIFGNDTGLAYFEECKIVAINRTKVDETTGKGKEQNGYVTAAKHDSKAKPDYGYVFYKCEMTDDGKVKDGAMSLGRSWGSKATIAYIECSFSKAYSVLPSDDSGKDHRWSDWGGGTKAEAADFKEYGSTGEGAISTAVKGGSIIDADTAALHTKDNLFGLENGTKVGYTAAWDYATAYSNLRKLVGLDSGSVVEDQTVDYKFNADTTGAIAKKGTTETGDNLFDGDMTVIATGSGVEYWTELTGTNGTKDFLWARPGVVIKLNNAGEVAVTTYGGDYGKPENVKINYIDGKAVITIVATETSAIGNGCCIKLIQLDKSKTPAHVHEYGAWTVTKDDGAETYTATRTCQACELETADTQTVNLPALNETDYVISAGSESGKSKYTYTDETYGAITFEADTLEGVHNHIWSAWEYDAETGKVTKTCSEDGCDEPTVELEVPALTDSGYVITNNTADLENAGTGTYTITIGEGEAAQEVSFTAATPKIELETISESKTYTARANKLEPTDVFFKNVTVFNTDYYKLVGTVADEGHSSIQFYVNAGAEITFYCNYWDNGIAVSGCGGTLEDVEGDATHKTYTANTAGLITITMAAGAKPQGYVREIAIHYGIKITEENLQEITTDGLIYNYAGDPSSTENVLITGGEEHSGYLWVRGGATVKLKVKAGYKITVVSEYDSGAAFIEADGTAADSEAITYTTSGNTVTTEYTATQEGIITIQEKTSQIYIKSITVTAE
ncbi:MAG: bacterial Ig-like domain-containing protein, partial [Clostridia bacterium]|nr:bacterial Ig-like domain-containing protein [Clostridia bacterium]